MKLIVGLGNPGDKYKKTRHNVGFMLLDKHVKGQNLEWKLEKKFNSLIARNENTLYVKPQTFMNKSGEAVSKIINYFEIKPEDFTLIHDDVDLEFGKVRDQVGRGDAGHKGVKDIVKKLKTKNFRRIRIGVGKSDNPAIDTEDWVLMNFSEEELTQILNLDITFI